MPMLARDLSGQRIFDANVDFRLVWWAAALGVVVAGHRDGPEADAFLWDLDHDKKQVRLFINTNAPDRYERSLEFLYSVLKTGMVAWAGLRPDAPPEDTSLLRFDEYPEVSATIYAMSYFRN